MKIKSGYMLREVDGVSIVVAIGDESTKFNGMIRLNSTGSFLWKLLSEGCDYNDLLNKMLEVYDVDETTAKNGINGFLNKLKENELLIND